ncbi:MAG: hypothetical protein CMC23_00360 [Flavobacteriaceae bacterium]|nr:hypothetical protein [Flavobacteriaceae bacterium]|tara:strand:- start:119 stop:1243 length:1125 start_codon:yes stop_codon:yes gene_type:complete
MKIVSVFLTYDYSLETWEKNGTLNRELKIFKEIAKSENIKFKFISYDKGYVLKNSDLQQYIEIVSIYKNLKYFNNKYLRFIYSFYIPFKIKEEVEKSDLIFQNQLDGSWISMITKKLTKKPLMIRTGYDAYQFSINENKNKLFVYFYRVLTKLSLKYSDLYTVTSLSDKNYLENNFKNAKVKITRNWSGLSKKNTENKRYSNKILCVGRLVEQKNYIFLINSLSKYKKSISIDIVGEGPEKNKIKNLSKEKNVEVNYLGKINHDNLSDIYQKYRLYAIPSKFEGNPKTLLEAMGNGCIVLASNIENHSEIIDNSINGFLFDLTEKDFFKTLDKFYSLNNLEVIDMQKNSYETIDLKYSFQVIKNEMIKDINNII